MLQSLFFLLCGGALLYALPRGLGAKTAEAMLTAAGEGVQAAIGLAGGFAFFCGLISILKKAGAARALGRACQPLLRTLLGRDVPKDVLEDAALNLSANMLGMGAAAAPMGLRAARGMAADGRATDGLCLFLVLNASSVQLLPSSVIALRAAAGSAAPGCIAGPTLIATLVSTLVGVLSCKVMERWT